MMNENKKHWSRDWLQFFIKDKIITLIRKGNKWNQNQNLKKRNRKKRYEDNLFFEDMDKKAKRNFS
jgi:membrane-anchored protein YejM (alkaline phosphatase superfamily)